MRQLTIESIKFTWNRIANYVCSHSKKDDGINWGTVLLLAHCMLLDPEHNMIHCMECEKQVRDINNIIRIDFKCE